MNDSKTSTETRALTIRLPSQLHAELKGIAEAKGWSVNDEINFRLRAFAVHENLAAVAGDMADIKAMLRQSLDSDC
jgi:hypothetical protein